MLKVVSCGCGELVVLGAGVCRFEVDGVNWLDAGWLEVLL